MDSNRKNAIIVGVLLIIATVSGILSRPFLGIIDHQDYLINVAKHDNQVILGILCQLIMAVACAGIAFWLYPVLKKHNEALAIGAVGFRTIEAILFFVASISIFSLIKLSQGFVIEGNSDTFHFLTLGTLLQTFRDSAFNFGIFAFSIGALMYYYIFYHSKLIPRWLSGWGLIGAALSLLVTFLIMFGEKSFSTVSVLLNLPIAIQEMVLAVWLIVKGFNSSVVDFSAIGKK